MTAATVVRMSSRYGSPRRMYDSGKPCAENSTGTVVRSASGTAAAAVRTRSQTAFR